MKRILIHSSFVLLSVVFAGAIVAAQQTAPPTQAKPEEKKEAPAIAGKWNVSVETPGGNRDSVLDMKVDGKKVTGTLASEMGETPIAGEYVDGKLTFTMSFDGGGQQITLTFVGAPKADGSLAGSIDFQGTAMNWTAVRAK
jgi:hypothetical protein